MDGVSSNWLGKGGGSGGAESRSGEELRMSSEETDIGEGWRGGLRLGGGGFVALEAFAGRAASGLAASSSSESEPSSLSAAMSRRSFESSSSSSSLTEPTRRAAVVNLGVFFGFVDSEPVVEMRGTGEGRCGLKGGALRLDAG